MMWLAQSAIAQAGDTLIMKTVTAAPSMFERISGIADGLASITLLVLTAALVPAAWNFRKSYKRVNQLLDRVYGDINPLMRHASAIADDVNYITTAVRADVQQVNQTVAAANERLREAMRQTERRLNDFHALLDVVQAEAEGTFISTAATVRGVRASAARFSGETADPDELVDGVDDADAADSLDLELDELEARLDSEEALDGDDDSDTFSPGRPEPRIRRRRPGGATG